MKPFRIVLEPHARRDFARLDEAVRRRFYAAFAQLEEDPFRPRPGCDIRALSGDEGVRAIRVGHYRGIYSIVGSDVKFTTFDHRRRAYR
jgi:mRNA-degrading endonuclease RelE of RelBE toxin-antitoxin system